MSQYRPRKCVGCGGRTLITHQADRDKGGNMRSARSCACGYTEKTVELKQEDLAAIRHAARLRCPTCDGPTATTSNKQSTNYFYRHRVCLKCNWSQKTYELSEEKFKMLIKAAKLFGPGVSNEVVSASGPTWASASSSKG